jgi:5'-nucleotidase
MHILVTNDDGVLAPSLLALAKAMRPLGKVTVLAPDHNWSASGHVKTLSRPLRVREVLLADGSAALTTDGAPSDCVALATLGLLDEKVDFVVSGINPSANIGHDLTYSGTVTAAMEAAIADLPAVAFSLDTPSENMKAPLDFSTAASVAQHVARQVLAHGLPPKTLLSVNIPYLPVEKLQGYQVTRQGLRIYKDQLVRREDPRGIPYYWIGGEAPSAVLEEGTDFWALSHGYVSITPVQLDLTAYALMDTVRTWAWDRF